MPTPVRSDNLADVQLGNHTGSAGRARHFLRRYVVFKQRLARGDVSLSHIPDVNNAFDFLAAPRG